MFSGQNFCFLGIWHKPWFAEPRLWGLWQFMSKSGPWSGVMFPPHMWLPAISHTDHFLSYILAFIYANPYIWNVLFYIFLLRKILTSLSAYLKCYLCIPKFRMILSLLWVPEIVSSFLVTSSLAQDCLLPFMVHHSGWGLYFFSFSSPVPGCVGNLVVMFVDLNSVCVINSFKNFSYSGSVSY